jgi:hypothetical protein
MHFDENDECKCGRELGARGGVAFIRPNFKTCKGAWCAYCVDESEYAIGECEGCHESFCADDCMDY